MVLINNIIEIPKIKPHRVYESLNAFMYSYILIVQGHMFLLENIFHRVVLIAIRLIKFIKIKSNEYIT